MALVLRLAGYAGMTLLGGLCAVVLWKLLSGGIRLDGLLDSTDSSGRRSFSPARLQLLGMTLLAGASYVSDVVNAPARDSLPAPSAELLAVLGASQLTYLGAKGFLAWIQPLLTKLK